MNCTTGTVFCCAAFLAAVSLSTTTHAQTTPFTKTQIADPPVKWKTAWTNSASIWRAAEETLRTGRNRRRAAERQRAGSVQIQRTQKLGGIKPSKQKTISKTPWTI